MACENPKIAWQRIKMPIEGRKDVKRLNALSFIPRQGWEKVKIPCGECPHCRLQKSNEWATRISNEAETWNGDGIFVTLTYNNPHLPLTEDGHMTLHRKDMQDYKKRLRKYIKKHKEAIHEWKNPNNGKIEKIIRTFECGEYGEKNKRPHYHQIIMNWIPNDLKFKEMSKDGYPLYKSKTLQKIWGNGFVLIGMISFESASYVARYTMKKQGLAKVERQYYEEWTYLEDKGIWGWKKRWKNKKGKIEPEFISGSLGIGKKWFIENKEKIIRNNGILINHKGEAKLKKLPRYYKKIWEKIDWEEYERFRMNYKKQMEKIIKKVIDSYNLPENWGYWQKERYIEQKTLDRQKHKYRLLKRDNITYEENEDLE